MIQIDDDHRFSFFSSLYPKAPKAASMQSWALRRILHYSLLTSCSSRESLYSSKVRKSSSRMAEGLLCSSGRHRPEPSSQETTCPRCRRARCGHCPGAVTTDHPAAELPFQSPDGNMCRGAVLLQPEAPSETPPPDPPARQRSAGGRDKHPGPLCSSALGQQCRMTCRLRITHWLWLLYLAEPRRIPPDTLE